MPTDSLAAAIERTYALRRACRSARQRAQELQGITLAIRHRAFVARSEAQSVRSQAVKAQRDLDALCQGEAMAFACPKRS